MRVRPPFMSKGDPGYLFTGVKTRMACANGGSTNDSPRRGCRWFGWHAAGGPEYWRYLSQIMMLQCFIPHNAGHREIYTTKQLNENETSRKH